MSEFCIQIKNQTPLFTPGYKHPHFPERTHINLNLQKDINPYWGKLLKGAGLVLSRVELFYGPENFPYTMGIHVDHACGDRAKINWLFGGKGSEMHWYKIVNPKQKEFLQTPVGSNYNLYEPDEVELLYTSTIKNPTLVQVGVPHNIVNPGQERWSYSMVVIDPRTKLHASFRKLRSVFGV